MGGVGLDRVVGKEARDSLVNVVTHDDLPLAVEGVAGAGGPEVAHKVASVPKRAAKASASASHQPPATSHQPPATDQGVD